MRAVWEANTTEFRKRKHVAGACSVIKEGMYYFSAHAVWLPRSRSKLSLPATSLEKMSLYNTLAQDESPPTR